MQKRLKLQKGNRLENIIEGILFLNKKLNHSLEPINVGSNKPIAIKDLVKKIHRYTNSKSKLNIGALKYRPNEIWKMQANNKFIISKGYKPKMNFDDGLKLTISWYRKFIASYLDKNSSFKNL